MMLRNSGYQTSSKTFYIVYTYTDLSLNLDLTHPFFE